MHLRDARHVDKFFYILNEGLFYEPFESRYQASYEFKALVEELITAFAKDWQITRDGVWYHVHPERFDLPVQGWKIHVSATPENSQAILSKVASIALANKVPFKFALDAKILSMMSSKAWSRGGSGKFITIYPKNLPCFKKLLQALYPMLRSEVGPYILSDKRYKDCAVLYYRFGGIRQNSRLELTGEKIPVLISPGGDTIPDIRTPYFAPPPWAHDPFATDESQSQGETTLKAGKYVVKRALAFSNSGGVYVAEDRDSGNQVVVKEARANTAIDQTSDAITRLKKEHAILELLKEADIAPRPLDAFYDLEHFFLVEEFMDGVDIRELMLTKSPLMLVRPSLEDSSRFYEIFTKTFQSFFQVLSTIHAHGVVFGDLSATNFIIDPATYKVRLIDFEGSFRVGVDRPTNLFTPGFRDPRKTRGSIKDFTDDYYALAAVMLYSLFPIAALASLRDDLYETVFRTLVDDVGWSHTQVANIVSGLSKGTVTSESAFELLDRPARLVAPHYSEETSSGSCEIICQELANFLLANIGTGVEDALFPADPFLYRTNNLSLGFGACGVLYALKKCGFEIPKVAYEWLEKTLDDCNTHELPPGLLTGASGVAWCLWELGLRDRAQEFMSIANRSSLLKRHHSQLYGMAGIGMANLYFYLRTKRSQYLTLANDLADSLLETVREDDRGIYWESDNVVHLGYGYGQSGVALFLLRLFQLNENENLLSHGRRALEFDLSHAVEIENGVCSFPRAPGDPTHEPYLEEGSAGIAKVALRYGISDGMEAILSDAWRKYATFAGLLYGLGSFVDVLTDAFIFSSDRRYLEMAQRPVAGIRDLYLIRLGRGTATPGDGLLRVSCDYATGTAGTLRALHRFAHFDESDFMLDEIPVGNLSSFHPGRNGESQRRAAVAVS